LLIPVADDRHDVVAGRAAIRHWFFEGQRSAGEGREGRAEVRFIVRKKRREDRPETNPPGALSAGLRAIYSGAAGMAAITNDLNYVACTGTARTAIIPIIRLRTIATRMRARLSFFVCHDLPPSKLSSQGRAVF
jgi:hypothetical protein